MAALHDEEFLDHERAAECLEAMLDFDGANDQALTTLPRHYRASASGRSSRSSTKSTPL